MVMYRGYRICWCLYLFATCLIMSLVQRTNCSVPREAKCGSVISLSGPASNVVSPGNYTSYDRNLDCQWLYKASDPADIILHKFYDVAVDCGDGLSSYDGNSTSDNKLQSDLCTTGSVLSTSLQTTSGRHLLVRFQTDSVSKESEKGFFTRAVSGKDLSSCPVSNSKVPLTATSEEQLLTSPKFPHLYPTNYSCEWTITTEVPDATIMLQFYFIDLDIGGNKCFDSVKVFEGDTEIKEKCGSEIFFPGDDSIVRSSGNQLRIVFRSDNIQTERGFKLGYRQIVPPTTSSTTTTTTTTTTTMPVTTTTTTTTTTPAITTTPTMTTTRTTMPGCCSVKCEKGKAICMDTDTLMAIVDRNISLFKECSLKASFFCKKGKIIYLFDKCKQLHEQVTSLCSPAEQSLCSRRQILWKIYSCLSWENYKKIKTSGLRFLKSLLHD